MNESEKWYIANQKNRINRNIESAIREMREAVELAERQSKFALQNNRHVEALSDTLSAIHNGFNTAMVTLRDCVNATNDIIETLEQIQKGKA